MPYIGRPIDAGDFKIITLSEAFDGNRVDFTMSESVGVAQLDKTGISAGKVFKVNDAGNAWELGNASSAEIYLFNKNGNNLQVITTNGGQDNITNTVYSGADEKMFAASGFTWSVNASGNLIATN